MRACAASGGSFTFTSAALAVGHRKGEWFVTETAEMPE